MYLFYKTLILYFYEVMNKITRDHIRCAFSSYVFIKFKCIQFIKRCCKLKRNIFYTALYFIYPTFFVNGKKIISICHVFLYWHACPQLRNFLRRLKENPTRKYNGGFNSQIRSFWPDLNAFDWWHHCWRHRALQRVPACPRWRDQSHWSAVVCVSVIHQMDSDHFRSIHFTFIKQ